MKKTKSQFLLFTWITTWAFVALFLVWRLRANVGPSGCVSFCLAGDSVIPDVNVCTLQDAIHYYQISQNNRLCEAAFIFATDAFRKIYASTESTCRTLDMADTGNILGDTFGSQDFRICLTSRLEQDGIEECRRIARENDSMVNLDYEIYAEHNARKLRAKVLLFDSILESCRKNSNIAKTLYRMPEYYGDSRQTIIAGLGMLETWELPYLVRFHRTILETWRDNQQSQIVGK